MRVWIDAAAATGAEHLFGLAPLERHIRALATSGSRPKQIVLSFAGPGSAPVATPSVEARAEQGSVGERLRRYLREAGDDTVVALDGGAVVDPRLVDFLGKSGAALVVRGGDEGERTVALCLTADLAEAVPVEAEGLVDCAEALLADGRVSELAPEDVPGFVAKLRRTVPPYLFAPRDEAARRRRERWMFWSNYKGSTDFLTKWVYPPLVWPLVRFCTRWRIHPNAVTVLGVVLTFAAVPLFAAGWFWTGLALAYAMTILDSVDGKVARLTLTASKLGDILDHGLDIVHPPFWYFAWAIGLGGRTADDPLVVGAVLLFLFYVGDRLVLMVAKAKFKRGLHAMTALDAAARTWIARRNVNLFMFTLGLLLGFPEAAFFAVVGWQGATMAWHAARTAFLIARPADAEAMLLGGTTGRRG